MKYAVVEREHRFVPSRDVDVSDAVRVLQIEDRYLIGTRLRLRTVLAAGVDPVFKLGQKVPVPGSRPPAVAHTSMYLDPAEHALLAALPSAVLSKTRHVVQLDDGPDVAVDVFGGALAGLTTLEIDLGASGSLPLPVPGWWGTEVTDRSEFTGWALATMDPASLPALLDTCARGETPPA